MIEAANIRDQVGRDVETRNCLSRRLEVSERSPRNFETSETDLSSKERSSCPSR